MFLIANCSPTGRASCRDRQMKVLIFSDVFTFQVLANQSICAVASSGVEFVAVSFRDLYPDLVEYSPFGFFSQTSSSGTFSLLGLMLRICSLLKGRTCSIISTFHSVDAGRRRSATVRER